MRKHIVYYVDKKGSKPVWEFIQGLSEDEQLKCLEYIGYLKEMGEELRRPIADYLGNKLYELRPKQTRIIYFFMLKDNAVLVHAFRKKTDDIPERETKLAIRRMNEVIAKIQTGEFKVEGDNL